MVALSKRSGMTAHICQEAFNELNYLSSGTGRGGYGNPLVSRPALKQRVAYRQA
jgi:hypothetical protein